MNVVNGECHSGFLYKKPHQAASGTFRPVVGDFLQSFPLVESLRGAILIVELDGNNAHYMYGVGVYYGHCYEDASMCYYFNTNQRPGASSPSA